MSLDNCSQDVLLNLMRVMPSNPGVWLMTTLLTLMGSLLALEADLLKFSRGDGACHEACICSKSTDTCNVVCLYSQVKMVWSTSSST